MAKKKPYEYGRSPAPTNWHEAADALRSLEKKTKRRGKEPSIRLSEFKRMLEESK